MVREKPLIVKADRVRDNKAKARAVVGSVPARKVITPKKLRDPKHKPDFTEES